MSASLSKTFEFLGKVKNEAAIPVLLHALDSENLDIQEEALFSLAKRHTLSGQKEILARWNQLPSEWKSRLAENKGVLQDAIREAIVSSNSDKCQIACEALTITKDYDLFPLLIKSATVRGPHQKLISRALVKLVEIFRSEFDNKRTKKRIPHADLIRKRTLESLETVLAKTDKIESIELLESFLILASREYPHYRELLANPGSPKYASVISILKTTRRGPLIDLILSSLTDPHAESSILKLIAQRKDQRFLKGLMNFLEQYQGDAVLKKNLARIQQSAIDEEHLEVLLSLTDAQQAMVIYFVEHCQLKQEAKYTVIKHLLIHGSASARLAAAEAMAEFHDAEANELIVKAINDEEPAVIAEALRQLRPRDTPGAINTLMHYLNHTELIITSAVRESLSEFNFPSYLASYEKMQEKVKIEMGNLVKQIDVNTIPLLSNELKSDNYPKVMRGFEITRNLQLATYVESDLIQLLAHEDFMIRVEAADLLGDCDSSRSTAALRKALLDRHVRVQEFAETSLQRIAKQSQNPTKSNSNHPPINPYLPEETTKGSRS